MECRDLRRDLRNPPASTGNRQSRHRSSSSVSSSSKAPPTAPTRRRSDASLSAGPLRSRRRRCRRRRPFFFRARRLFAAAADAAEARERAFFARTSARRVLGQVHARFRPLHELFAFALAFLSARLRLRLEIALRDDGGDPRRFLLRGDAGGDGVARVVATRRVPPYHKRRIAFGFVVVSNAFLFGHAILSRRRVGRSPNEGVRAAVAPQHLVQSRAVALVGARRRVAGVANGAPRERRRRLLAPRVARVAHRRVDVVSAPPERLHDRGSLARGESRGILRSIWIPSILERRGGSRASAAARVRFGDVRRGAVVAVLSSRFVAARFGAAARRVRRAHVTNQLRGEGLGDRGGVVRRVRDGRKRGFERRRVFRNRNRNWNVSRRRSIRRLRSIAASRSRRGLDERRSCRERELSERPGRGIGRGVSRARRREVVARRVFARSVRLPVGRAEETDVHHFGGARRRRRRDIASQRHRDSRVAEQRERFGFGDRKRVAARVARHRGAQPSDLQPLPALAAVRGAPQRRARRVLFAKNEERRLFPRFAKQTRLRAREVVRSSLGDDGVRRARRPVPDEVRAPHDRRVARERLAHEVGVGVEEPPAVAAAR